MVYMRNKKKNNNVFFNRFYFSQLCSSITAAIERWSGKVKQDISRGYYRPPAAILNILNKFLFLFLFFYFLCCYFFYLYFPPSWKEHALNLCPRGKCLITVFHIFNYTMIIISLDWQWKNIFNHNFDCPYEKDERRLTTTTTTTTKNQCIDYKMKVNYAKYTRKYYLLTEVKIRKKISTHMTHGK